jgi:Uma2 family endonuclease
MAENGTPSIMTKHEPVEPATAHQPYKFTQRDYLLLSEHGAFDKLAKAELIEGVIVAVNAQYARHVRVQTLLLRALADSCDRLGRDLGAWIEGTVSIAEGNMPQPDIFVSRGLPDEGPMTVDRLVLVVEVADTSLTLDLETKARIYAAAGIPEYWVADVEGKVIHQLWAPEGEAYGQRREVAFGAQIEAVTVAGLVVEGVL